MPLTKIQSLGITDGTIVNADINASAAIASTKLSGSFGKVLQVIQTVKSDTFSTSSASLVDVTGLSVSITPSSASNKILVTLDLKGWAQNANQGGVTLLRNSTAIYIGDTAGDRTRISGAGMFNNASPVQVMGNAFAVFLDSPNTTSSTTYKVQVFTLSNNVRINRTDNDLDQADASRATSSITVMEIAA